MEQEKRDDRKGNRADATALGTGYLGTVGAVALDADGNIEDKNGVCALDDATFGECNSGPFKPGAEFFWDAADHVPASDSRVLYVSNTGVTSGLLPPAFTQANISAADLFVQPFTAPPDHAPNAHAHQLCFQKA